MWYKKVMVHELSGVYLRYHKNETWVEFCVDLYRFSSPEYIDRYTFIQCGVYFR